MCIPWEIFPCTFLHKIASIEVNKFGGFIEFSYLCRRKGEWSWRGHYGLYIIINCALDGFAEGCEGTADATGLSCLRASDDGLRGCGLRFLRHRFAEVY